LNNHVPPQKKWVVRTSIPEEIERELAGYPDILQQLLHNRSIQSQEDAEIYTNKQGSLYDPFLLLGMEKAVDRILQALKNQESIAVYGDYDVDGVTATALLVQALQAMDARVRGFIPNRFEEGYGLSKEPLQKLSDEGVNLLITVDCGIRSWQEVDFWNGLGKDLIITDHHEPHEKVPDALAVICPKQEGDLYPEKNLAGVGLAFKFCEALYRKQPPASKQAEDFYDLVAVGTVADIVPLTGENRTLVKAGLNELHFGKRLGLRSLANVAGISIEKLNARDIGFGIGPRLNASGRLKTAQMAYDLMMSDDINVAGKLAQQLDDLNRKRQDQTRIHVEKAEMMLADKPEADIIIAFDPEFNKGIVGLVASKLVEKYYRPAVVGQIEEGQIRASCRSIPEFHITRALDECADLFEHHGGHAMAAGFTLLPENEPAFRERLESITRRELGEMDLYPELIIDQEIHLEKTRPVEIFDALSKLEPTGQTNPEAVFCSYNVQVLQFWPVGEGRHLKLKLKAGGVIYNAIAFRQGHLKETLSKFIDIAYTFEKNYYKGIEETQLNIRDIQPSHNNSKEQDHETQAVE
jgi:single-stranded-DNA-specific exonuclease